MQAFRRTGLPMQRIRKALALLSSQGELDHALASRQLCSDGANVLYDYARRESDDQLRLLTVVSSGHRVFHEVIEEYLSRITFGDDWATELVVPVTEHNVLRIRPAIANGDPLFVHGGAPLPAVRSRYQAGEPITSIAEDFGVPVADIAETIDALWPQKTQPDDDPIVFFLDRCLGRHRLAEMLREASGEVRDRTDHDVL